MLLRSRLGTQALVAAFLGYPVVAYGQCDSKLIPYEFFTSGEGTYIKHQGEGSGRDSTGVYEGLYAYTDNQKGVVSDTNSFWLGRFRHGQPIGEWKAYCKDGSYGLGEFSGGGPESTLGDTGVVVRQEGITAKQGIWHYYHKDGTLAATYRYDRQRLKRGTIDKTYKIDSTGNFRLTWLSTIPASALWKMRVREQTYSDKGKLLTAHVESIWREVYWEYYPSGILETKRKQKRIHWFNAAITIAWHYTPRGELRQIVKTKDKRLRSPHAKRW